jgi:aspartate beta-hydroxylase
MKAGEFTRHWEEGKVFCCDTSFMHETWNGTNGTRYVLIMRHWHPELSPVERVAAQFLFDAVDIGMRVARTLAAKRIRALMAPVPSSKGSSSSSGNGNGSSSGAKKDKKKNKKKK